MTDTPEKDDQGHRKWPWFILALVILAVAGGGYWWLSQPGDQAGSSQRLPSPLVRATEVEAAENVILRQTGFVRASDAIDVVPEMAERIVEIGDDFAVGGTVAQGNLLVRLDATSARANLRSAEARLRQAEVALDETEIALARQQELRDEQVISEAALDDAQVASARAEADVAVAEAEVSRAALALDDTGLRAPFDAIVTEQSAAMGQLVQPGTAIGRLVATDFVEIEMGLLPSDIAVLGRAAAAIGLPVAIFDAATDRMLREGRVDAVVPALNAQTQTIGLLVRVSDPFTEVEAPLRIGALVDLALDVPLDGDSAVRVRAEALKGGDTIWTIAEGRLGRHEVRVLSRDGDTVTLRADGIAPGDRVLLSDLAAPVDGDRVRLADESMQTAEGG